MAGNGSMNIPSSNRLILTRSRNSHGWCATLVTHCASCTATCSAVISHASAPVAPMIIITTELVRSERSNIGGKSRQVTSR
jgi:hypothetical protein